MIKIGEDTEEKFLLQNDKDNNVKNDIVTTLRTNAPTSRNFTTLLPLSRKLF